MAYTPAGNLTSTASLAHLAQVFYKKRGLSVLQKKFVFREACLNDMVPKQSGKTVQWFRYQNLAANVTPTTEGTVGTSLALTSKIVAATVSQYSNFITVSDVLKDTAIDPVVQSASERLGYQGGLSVDTITRTIIDDESASTNQALLATYLKVADLRQAYAQLQADDVEPFEDGNMLVYLHPFASYDLINDPSANGLADIFKYTTPGKAGLVNREDRGQVTVVAGCKLIESTNVKTQSGPARYRVYVFGKDAVGAVDLEGRGPARVKDPKKQRFNINVITGGPDKADPEGLIGAGVSYNYLYTSAVLEGPSGIGGVYRYITLDPESTIS